MERKNAAPRGHGHRSHLKSHFGDCQQPRRESCCGQIQLPHRCGGGAGAPASPACPQRCFLTSSPLHPACDSLSHVCSGTRLPCGSPGAPVPHRLPPWPHEAGRHPVLLPHEGHRAQERVSPVPDSRPPAGKARGDPRPSTPLPPPPPGEGSAGAARAPTGREQGRPGLHAPRTPLPVGNDVSMSQRLPQWARSGVYVWTAERTHPTGFQPGHSSSPRQGPPFSVCHYLTPDAVLSSLCRRRGRTVPSAPRAPPASVFSSAHTPRFSPSAAQPLAPNSLTRPEALCQCTGTLGTGVDPPASRDSPVLPQGTFAEEQTARCCSDLEDEPGPGGRSRRTTTWAAQGCSERDVQGRGSGVLGKEQEGPRILCSHKRVFLQ